MKLSRRNLLKLLAYAAPASCVGGSLEAIAAQLAAASSGQAPARGAASGAAARSIAPGPFLPTWESLIANYKAPEWFRDAKLGLWAHWSAQCVPEQGDWYARQMYIQGHPQYQYHVRTYGHPSRFGFMELDNLWKAEKWDPEAMMDLYVKAGAKYFVSLANHHDNFDNYDSRHHAWNSTKIGPKKDIVGTWARIARARGLRFGVTNHSAHAWHWFQTAYGYDAQGGMAGVRYDAYTLTKEDGKGTWWEGLDPKELYGGGPNMVIPDGIKTIQAMQQWHEQHDRVWDENPPPMNPRFTEQWFLRCQDLVDRYEPDLLYFDNFGLPLGQAGLDMAAHFYNANIAKHGRLEAVLNAKQLPAAHKPAMVEDHERSAANVIEPAPWQTDTCIGDWHYRRDIRYKTVGQVVQMLADIVSKNGNLLLNIPVRGDGTFDEREIAFLQGLAKWMDVNKEGIHGTRPWKVFGEGPTQVATGMFSESRNRFGAQDVRFTSKGETLYMYLLGIPTEAVKVRALGLAAEHARPVAQIKLLGSDEPLRFTQARDALTIEKPRAFPSADVAGFKIAFK